MKFRASRRKFWKTTGRILSSFAIALSSLLCLSSCLETWSVQAAATAPFVQEKDNQVVSGTTNSVTLAAPTTAGNLIAVYVIWDSTGSVSLSDSGGNTYVNAVGPTLWNSNKYSTQIFYAKNIRGGADTVSARFSTAVRSFGIVYVHEYSQLDRVSPVDVTAAAVGSGSTLNSGSVATANATNLLFGAGVSMTTVSRAGTSYTARSFAQGNITQDRVVSTAGSYNATATNSSGGWGMQMVAFRFAGSAPADTSPPTVPTGVSGTPMSSSQINLSWTASTDPDNTAGQLTYRVYRNSSLIGTTTAGTTAWQDKGVLPSTTYSYTVSAVDPSGNASAPSGSVQATTPAAMPVISSFNANPKSIIAGQTTRLSWSTSNATSLVIDNGVGTVTSLTSKTITPAATATYTLTASNSSGSAQAQVTVTLSADTVAPSVPSLRATAVSSTQANVSWTASTDNVGVAYYQLYRDGTPLLQTSSTSYSDNALTAGTTYSYTVAASDAAGNSSAQSAPASVTPGQSDTQAPSVSITSPTSNQTVSGTWTVTANASDNVGIRGVQFLLDGSNLGQESTSAPYSAAWNSAQTSDGTHVVTAVARDAAGNKTTSAGISVKVSNSSSGSSARPYTTTFPATENPISEGGNWINGRSSGLDWADIQTKPGFAFGTESGTGRYDDSTALLSGTWGPDQTVQATVHTVNQSTNDNVYEEVELRLRSSLSAHRATGYEINFRCSKTSNAYTQIVRWNGPLGSFTQLNGNGGAQYGVKDGDVIKATIVGNVITAYLNGVQVDQVTDNTFTSGNPGMGFYVENASGATVDGDYGFTSFSASDGSTTNSTTDSGPPSVPTNLAASTVSSSQINLAWTASTDDVGTVGYQVFRNNSQIATTATASFSDTGLVADTQYSYTVVAYDAAGNVSSQSAAANAMTSGPDVTPPSVPNITQSSKITSSSLNIAWSAATDDSGVAGYQIFRNGTQVGTATLTNYTDNGLSPATIYSYTVAAFDYSNNVSTQSSAYQVTTAASPATPPSIVQSTQNQTARGSSTAAAFNTSTIAGHTIVAYVIWDNTGGATVTDSRGNTFVAASAPTIWAGKYSAQVFYATNILGGADTITATFKTAASSFGVLYIHEYAGISTANPVDVTASASGSSTQLNSGTVTTTSPNDLIFGAGVSDNAVTAAGSGFTARNMSYGNITEDRVANTVGAVSAIATHNGKMWGMQLVAFRPAN